MTINIRKHRYWWCVEWNTTKGLFQMLFASELFAGEYAAAIRNDNLETMKLLERRRLWRVTKHGNTRTRR